MLYGLYLSTAGAKGQSYRQDIIANNLANIDATGFKRQFAVLQERPNHLSEFGYPPPVNPADPRRMEGGLHMYQTPSDLTPGTYKTTGRDLDVAIQGNGFFQVLRQGQIYLTRNGSFTLDARGTLRTNDGEGIILGRGSQPIQVDGTQLVTFAPDGGVYQNENQVGQLSLAAPLDPNRIERAGNGLLQAQGGIRPADGQVRQGMLEGSNVEPILSMTDLIESARGFDLNIQMIQLQSDSLANLIQTVPRLQ